MRRTSDQSSHGPWVKRMTFVLIGFMISQNLQGWYATHRAYRGRSLDMSTKPLWVSRRVTTTAAVLVLAAAVLVEAPAEGVAAESAKSVYLLGSSAGLAGFVPPPACISPTSTTTTAPAHPPPPPTASCSGTSATSPGRPSQRRLGCVHHHPRHPVGSAGRLFGGRFGVGVLAPIGWQQASGSVEVDRTLTLANGHTYSRGSRLSFGDETTSFGDRWSLLPRLGQRQLAHQDHRAAQHPDRGV
jgi:hypothetical protein